MSLESRPDISAPYKLGHEIRGGKFDGAVYGGTSSEDGSPLWVLALPSMLAMSFTDAVRRTSALLYLPALNELLSLSGLFNGRYIRGYDPENSLGHWTSTPGEHLGEDGATRRKLQMRSGSVSSTKEGSLGQVCFIVRTI